MIVLLGLVLIRPRGLINFEQFEAKDRLVAVHEGTANCTLTIKLKEHQQFYIRGACFGVEEASGNYQIDNDTIRLVFSSGNNDAKAYQFGVFKKIIHYDKKPAQEILLYRSPTDTLPVILDVVKNDLMK